MYLAVAGSDRKFKILDKYDQVKPTNPGNACDLVKHPNTNQLVPAGQAMSADMAPNPGLTRARPWISRRIVGIQVLYAIASLALILISLGLAIIFGMMRIINLAHGEFLMLGAYATCPPTNHGRQHLDRDAGGLAGLVGLVGLVVERTLIRFLYGRLVDTMLATWGLQPVHRRLVTTIFGNTSRACRRRSAASTVGATVEPLHALPRPRRALLLLGGVIVVLRYTRFGLIARATMQNPNMASALGVNPTGSTWSTFAIGAAVTGLAGALAGAGLGHLAHLGAAFVAKAFITVVGGGASILAGTASASALFGSINQMGSYRHTPVFGEVILLVAATVLIRMLPEGITGRFFRGSL